MNAPLVEAGLNFIALSTSDCKVGFIGHAAAKIKEVFNEARSKQPTLIFIDELDAVCPTRGDYHDCISQEVTAQLLQEIDGLQSDTQAIFLVGATNRPDQIDSAILSRFAERIEIHCRMPRPVKRKRDRSNLGGFAYRRGPQAVPKITSSGE